ncbi:hypothetical protein GKC56_03600 [Neisseriaceae bacterium PsAf]|nr:hypothetical protein [Neisseriaceae bacterium PsAf]MCV2503721.1 hypothetical protein [Neisseriaceae bacterium]
MKKSFVAVMVMSLFIAGGCSTSGSNASSTTNQQVTQMAKEPEKQFLQVVYTKDAGQVEFNQYLKSVGAIDSQAKQAQVEAKYDQINKNTLNNLKKLKPTDPEVKSYLDSLINLAQLSDEINTKQAQLAVEYQKNKKLSPESKTKLDSLGKQVQLAYTSAMEKEVRLTQQYANATTGAVKDFMYVQSILNNELVEVSVLQQKLFSDSTIKSEAQFNKKATPGLVAAANNTIKSLKTVNSTDADVNAYVNKLIESYQVKLQMIKKKDQIAAEQKKGKISQNNVNLINRYQDLDYQTTKMRIDLINKYMN